MICLRIENGLPRARCLCDVCDLAIDDAAGVEVLQPMVGLCWHVHSMGCSLKALGRLGWLRARQPLEDHLHELAAILECGTPFENGELGEFDAEKLPPPGNVAAAAMSLAWRDDIEDEHRLVFEQAAQTSDGLMDRCVQLARAGEQREAG